MYVTSSVLECRMIRGEEDTMKSQTPSFRYQLIIRCRSDGPLIVSDLKLFVSVSHLLPSPT